VHSYITRGTLFAHRKKYEEALKDFDFAIYLDPREASLYKNRGEIHYELQQYKESFESYRKYMLLSYSGNHLNFYKEMFGSYWNIIHNDIERLYLSRTKMREALNTLFNFRIKIDTAVSFLHLISFSHNTANAYNVRGRALFSRGHYKEALVAFEIAIQIEPEDADFWYNKGDTLRQLEKVEESEKAYEQAKKLDKT
jgi:tetratricopeptide (TPR) repeat protein